MSHVWHTVARTAAQGSQASGHPGSCKVGLALLLDAGWAWLAVLLAGLLSQVVLVEWLHQQAARELHRAQVALTLQSVQDQFEADLQSGVPLARNMRAQQLLEDTVALDTRLLAAEVFDPSGLSLFNTDRGAVGERVPDPWLAAAREGLAQPDQFNSWNLSSPERVIGVTLHDATGQGVGHLGLTLRPVPEVPWLVGLPWLLAWALAVLLLALVGLRRVLHARQAAQTDDIALRAHQRLAAIAERLTNVLERLAPESD